jgi:hypothetical protein
MHERDRRWPPRVVLAVALLAAPAAAQRTPLLQSDLKTGKVKRIDQSGPKTAAESDLDSMLDKATGGASFTTGDLEKVEKALRRFLEVQRPRAMPRLLLFLYPGRITANLLKELREVKVDVELVVDPCARTVCVDSVGKHIELLGKAMRQAVIRTSKYVVRFGSITIRTATDMAGTEYEQYRFTADDVVRAGQSGGGGKLVGKLSSEKEGYARQMVKEVAQRLKVRRVQLGKPPAVQRDARSVSVELAIQSDRVREKSDVLAAFAGAAEALRKSALTPAVASYRVVAAIPFRRLEHHSYSCIGQALGLYLDGKLSQSQIWATYIVEKKKGGKEMTFDDEEASGRKPTAGGDDDEGEDRVGDVLAAHTAELAPCLTAEAARNRAFKGVTLTFSVEGGRATRVGVKESGASGALRSCVAAALARIRFPRRGAKRQVEYPMFIKR